MKRELQIKWAVNIATCGDVIIDLWSVNMFKKQPVIFLYFYSILLMWVAEFKVKQWLLIVNTVLESCIGGIAIRIIGVDVNL